MNGRIQMQKQEKNILLLNNLKGEFLLSFFLILGKNKYIAYLYLLDKIKYVYIYFLKNKIY
jgi:hypothetical protein